ncbi:MAG TPA: alanine--tRNA ligase-related protein, partial [Devosia sp.]|nr:alanine--tRNA ligase-related protein [Devosia sp.]
MTDFVFRTDSYLRTLDATIAEITPEGGIGLDRTIFYATSGGQPNDTGRLIAGERIVPIVNVVHPEGDKTRIIHLPAAGTPALRPGESVKLEL